MTSPSRLAEPVAPPKHAMHALTTYELRDYRRQMESAITGQGRVQEVTGLTGQRDRRRA